MPTLVIPAPSFRGPSAIRSASRLRSARRTRPGPSASAASGRVAVGHGLGAGSATVAITGPDATGAGHTEADAWRKPIGSPGWQSGLMCGRYASARKRRELLEEFEVELDSEEELAPTTTSPPPRTCTRSLEPRPQGGGCHPADQAVAVWSRWGLVPSWAKDPSIGSAHDQRQDRDGRRKPASPPGLRDPPLPAARRLADAYGWMPTDDKRDGQPTSSTRKTAECWPWRGLARVLEEPPKTSGSCTLHGHHPGRGRPPGPQPRPQCPVLIPRGKWAEWLRPQGCGRAPRNSSFRPLRGGPGRLPWPTRRWETSATTGEQLIAHFGTGGDTGSAVPRGGPRRRSTERGGRRSPQLEHV